MIITLALGLIIRLISLNQSFWLDEATTGNVARNFSYLEIITKFAPGDFHPPLYYLFTKFLSTFFGTSEVGLRLISVVFAILTIYMVYKLSKIAALFLATSGLHIYYSQEARMYAMETFLVTALIFVFTKILNKDKIIFWILFAITLPLIFLTDYLPILILIPIWLITFRSKKSFIWWKKFLLSHIPLLVSVIVWLPIFAKQLNAGLGVATNSPAWWQTLGKTNLKELLLLPTKFMIGRISFDNKMVYALFVFVAGILFGYLLIKSLRKSALFWTWLLIPVLVGAVVGMKISVFSYFRFLFVLPAFYVLAGNGVTNIKEKNIKKLLIAGVLVVNLLTSGIYLFNSRFHREDWRSAVNYIESSKDMETTIVFPSNSQQEAYKYYSPNTQILSRDNLDESYKKVWLMRYAQSISDPQDLTRKKVESLGYKKDKELDFNGVVVWEYKAR